MRIQRILICLAFATPLYAQECGLDRLQALCLEVQLDDTGIGDKKDLERAGFTKSSIQRDVELELMSRKISYSDSLQPVILQINVSLMPIEGVPLYVASISVSASQLSFPLRYLLMMIGRGGWDAVCKMNKDTLTAGIIKASSLATSWERQGTFYAGADRLSTVRGNVIEMLKEFELVYFKSNPPH